ncbi:MAG: hypothetical protein JK586_06575 [Nocardiopsis sp. BM-2018]|nr:MAG: hypothetical protein JK586_06575 [Nocardiopsis sp. BM-2018]
MPQTNDHALPTGLDLNDRSPTVFGWVFALLGSGGVLLFWAMGAVLLHTGNGGTIVQLELEGLWRAAFLSYPFVLIGFVLIGGALVALKRDLESIGAVGTPAALAVLYYLALLYLRPV